MVYVVAKRGVDNLTWRLPLFGDVILRTVSHTRWRPAMDNGAKAQTPLRRHGRNDGVHGDLIGLMHNFKHNDEPGDRIQ